jgi:hypothetical protein
MRFIGAFLALIGVVVVAIAGQVIVTGQGDQGLAIVAVVLSLLGVWVGVWIMISD